jgi:hypothetical protein
MEWVCAEHPHIVGSRCSTKNNSCVAGQYLAKGHGRMTGASHNRNIYELFYWPDGKIRQTLQIKKN